MKNHSKGENLNNLSFLKDKHLLYVEDDELVRESTSLVLQLFFKNIKIFDDGGNALICVNNESFDIAILDLKLPKVNGLEIAKALKEKNPNTLIIMISSFHDIEYLRTSLQIGMIDFIPKPLKFDDLKFALNQCVDRLLKNQFVQISSNLRFNCLTKVIYYDEEKIPLTKNEISFIELLIKYNGQIISYDLISKEVFKNLNHIDVNIASIKNLILRLRKKLHSPLVENIFGVGYRVSY